MDAEPFPDLAHATTVLVAGAGAGKVSKYASRLCATPVPIITGGVDYSYVYSAAGGRADLGKFALVVPAGTLADPVGQWLRITPQQTPTSDLPGPAWPSAEFSILGARWTDGVKRVYVTLPTDPELAEFGDTATPVVAHWSDGARSNGDIADTQVDSAAKTVTAAVTHLSVLDAISEGISWVAEPLGGLLLDARFPAPSCSGSWTLDRSTGSWTNGTARVDLSGAMLDLPGNTVPPFGWPQKHCIESAPGSGYDARLKLVNNTRTFESLVPYNGGGSASLGDVQLVGGDALQILIAGSAELALKHPVAYPGGEVSVTVPSGRHGAVRMTPNVPLTALWTVLDQSPVKEFLDTVGDSAPGASEVVSQDIGCMLGLLSAKDSLDQGAWNRVDGLAGVLKSCIDLEGIRVQILDAEHAGKLSADQVGKVGVALNKLQRYLLWLRVGEVGITGLDTWFGYAGGSAAGIVSIDNFAPKPAKDSLGRNVQPACLKADGLGWSIDSSCQNAFYLDRTPPLSGGTATPAGLPGGKMVRNAAGNAWFVNYQTQTIQPIADGGTYLCLAKHYPVDWDGSESDYVSAGSAFRSTPASCDNALPDDRPINRGETDDRTIVLRQADGSAWVIWDGMREPIPTGAEFGCWVNQQHAANIEFDVWDQVTSAQLANWQIDPAVRVSNCGDPAAPSF